MDRFESAFENLSSARRHLISMREEGEDESFRAAMVRVRSGAGSPSAWRNTVTLARAASEWSAESPSVASPMRTSHNAARNDSSSPSSRIEIR